MNGMVQCSKKAYEKEFIQYAGKLAIFSTQTILPDDPVRRDYRRCLWKKRNGAVPILGYVRLGENVKFYHKVGG